jgi:hypothetical protein
VGLSKSFYSVEKSRPLVENKKQIQIGICFCTNRKKITGKVIPFRWWAMRNSAKRATGERRSGVRFRQSANGGRSDTLSFEKQNIGDENAEWGMYDKRKKITNGRSFFDGGR